MKIRELISEMKLGIQQNGFRWWLRNCWSEMNAAVQKTVHKFMSFLTTQSKDTLFAYYDLEGSPVTYDFIYFIVGAYLQRKSLGLNKLKVIIVPGKKNGLRDEGKEYEHVINHNMRLWRLNNILVPLHLAMIPNSDLQIVHSRDTVKKEMSRSKYIYPPDYHVEKPTYISASLYSSINKAMWEDGFQSYFTSGIAGRQYIEAWLKSVKCGKRLVVITLRNYKYFPERNSNIQAWLEFARSLDPKIYTPVFIPDTDSAYDDTMIELANEFHVMQEASFNLHIRLALCEYAYLNMSVSNGPSNLFVLNAHCRYLFLKIITPAAPQTTEAVWRSYGYVLGQSPKYATNLQKWVWEDDDYDTLVREFSEFVKRAEKLNAPDVPSLPELKF